MAWRGVARRRSAAESTETVMIQDMDAGASDRPPRELGHSAIVSVEFEVFGQVQGE